MIVASGPRTPDALIRPAGPCGDTPRAASVSARSPKSISKRRKIRFPELRSIIIHVSHLAISALGSGHTAGPEARFPRRNGPDRLALPVGEPAFTPEACWGARRSGSRWSACSAFVCWVVSWMIDRLQAAMLAKGAGLITSGWLPSCDRLRAAPGPETTNGFPLCGSARPARQPARLACCLLICVVWVEVGLWRAIRRYGGAADSGARRHPPGIRAGPGRRGRDASGRPGSTRARPAHALADGIINGRPDGRDLHGLRRPRRGSRLLVGELINVRGRRLYAIARLSVIESNRRMWAPWVVITVFLLILAFTHWFLQPPRPAEMGRLFVGTLTLLCSLLLTVMVTILTPLSLPRTSSSRRSTRSSRSRCGGSS